MKTRTATIILFSILLFAYSCKKETLTVQGRWRPIAVDSIYVKSFHLSTEGKKEMMDKHLIGFQKGGTFFSFQNKDSVRGLYTYDESNKKLTTTPDGKGSQTFVVKFLEPDVITLTNAFGTMKLRRL